MKIGIIAFWDRIAVPYLSKYEELLNSLGIPYDSILWDRSQTAPVTVEDKTLFLHRKLRGGVAGKVIGFFQWRKDILKILKTNHYSGLIVLTTHPAILISSYLKRHYRNAYIFDIRDYTQEKYTVYRRQVMKLIDRSSLTAISSKGFMRFLEAHPKIVPNHNITVQPGNTVSELNETKRPIEFSFVGNVRLDRQTEAMLLTLGNDPNIHMRFVGRIVPGCRIRELIQEHGITNVSLEGAFDVSQKPEIYADTDLINTVYANDTEDRLALGDSTPIPNRLYDALVFRRPMIASRGTYLAQIIEKYHLGLVVNGFDKDLSEQIETYFRTFDHKAFSKGCTELLKEVTEEEEIFLCRLKDVLKEWTEQYDCQLQRN